VKGVIKFQFLLNSVDKVSDFYLLQCIAHQKRRDIKREKKKSEIGKNEIGNINAYVHLNHLKERNKEGIKRKLV